MSEVYQSTNPSLRNSPMTKNSIDKKKRILLIWYEMPNRPELLEPFINLSGQFEFIHLFFNTPEDRKVEISPFRMIYWLDYSSPYVLINKIKPDIIFSEFPSDLKVIALSIASKNLKIPFISMVHGIFFEDSYDINLPNYSSIFHIKRYYKFLRILLFYLSTIQRKNTKYLLNIFRFLFHFIKYGNFNASGKFRFELSWPDRYIAYQLKNVVEIIRVRYKYPEEKITAIGIPQFDSMFQYWNSFNSENNSSDSDYYLMIDTAWIFNIDMPPTDVIYSTYLRLSDYCKLKGCKLIVKLHPYWYGNKDFPLNENIIYLRNVPQIELTELIIKAKGCFLYFSTLSIPIVPYKNSYFLYYKKITKDINDITTLRVAKSLDIDELDINNIDFNNGFDRTYIYKYIQDYLFSIDGNATKRLANILTAQSS